MQISSIEAYHQVEDRGTAGTQRERIYRFIRDHGPCTARQVAQALQMETATVAARVNALKNAGVVSETLERIKCPITGMLVTGLMDAPPQRKLFQ